MKKWTLKILSVIFILTLVSCNFPLSRKPESKDTAPTFAAGSTEVSTPTIAAPPEPLPTGFSDLLQQKVDSGEWTREEGLLTILKVFVGEITSDAAGLGQGVLEPEGTGILLEAGDYLHSGTDQATKDEIIRLLSILVPTQEKLDPYSIPESQAFMDPKKMAAPARQTPEECGLLWNDGFPDRRDPTFWCFLYGEQVVNDNPYRVYYPLAWYGDASRDPYYSAVQETVVDAVEKYKIYGTLPPIYFVFNTFSSPNSFLAEVSQYFRPETEACPVIIYPISLGLDIDDFKQVVAHEVFHCFQFINLREQFSLSGRISLWWLEGTAEYFSNLVYPANDFEYRFAESFSRLSTFTPITKMTYENFAFFQFLGNRFTPEGLIAMIRDHISAVPEDDAQLAALAAVPGMDATFEEFVRSLIDITLEDSSTALAVIPENYSGSFPIADITSGVFSGYPFVADRYKITFEKEKKYAIETLSEGPGFYALRPGELPGGWGPMPLELASGCVDRPIILYVINTTPLSEQTETVNITNVSDSPCDRCLLGRWEATEGSVLSYMQSINPSSGENGLTVDNVRGVMFMEFGENGIGSGGYELLSVHQAGKGTASGTEAYLTFDGSTTGPYTADGTELIGLSGTGKLNVKVEMLMNGKLLVSSDKLIRPEDFPVGTTTPTRYVCEGDSLTTWPPVEGITVDPVIWNHASP
ncbi:MAG: hypothetical protein NTZ74_11725 [Chloroflexi bacterium]|nr:hypothetical protein [Chloroflexota bacterium]